MTFKIKLNSWVDVWDRPVAPGPGYNADDYLPNFADQEFASSEDAAIWLVQNYKGSDVDGIGCSFDIYKDAECVFGCTTLGEQCRNSRYCPALAKSQAQ